MNTPYLCRFVSPEGDDYGALFEVETLSEAVRSVVSIEESRNVQVIMMMAISHEEAWEIREAQFNARH